MTALIITGVVFSVCIVAMLYVARKMDEYENIGFRTSTKQQNRGIINMITQDELEEFIEDLIK